MVLAVVQDKYAEVDFFETLDLDALPTAGNLLIVWESLRETDLDSAVSPGPNGFTVHPNAAVHANSDSARLSIREVEPGDSATLTGMTPGSMAYAVEVSGWDSWEWGDGLENQTLDPISFDVDMAGEGWAFLGLIWRTPTDFATEAIAPTGDTVELNDAKSGLGFVYHPLSWVAYTPVDSNGTVAVTGDPNGALTHTWAGEALSIYVGGDLPEPPPVDPGYETPDPPHAILEIYVHDEGATRWGTATWGDDPPTGTTGIWSGEGWQDITPQGINAHVTFGSTRAERGILARQEAQSWLVTTYDPDRVLDPGNVDSPYYPQLISGVPIRLSNAGSGRVVRTAVVDRISYQYKRPDYRGTILASSTIARLYRAEVPADSILGDTLRERIIDAVTSSGIAIGGIAITGFDDSYPDIPLATLGENPRTVWETIYQACEEVGWIPYEDEHGTIQVRPYGNPVDRGSEITYANLEDLTSESSEDGVYSVVRVLNEDGSAVVERVAAPLPRYGRVAFTDRENVRTIDPDGYAAAILADRAWPGITWTPGTVWAFDAAEVDFYCSLELVERVGLVFPGVLDVSGVILGMEVWVESRTAERSRWLFLPHMAVDGSSSPGAPALLVADDDGSFLMADDGSGDYLEADG